MKILLINNIHYKRGGADIVYLNTGDLLQKHGHEVFFFSQKDERNCPAETSSYFINPVDYFGKSTLGKLLSVPRFLYSKEAGRKLGQLIRDHKPDIAHIHLYKGSLTPAILPVLKKEGIPTIATLHDYGFLCPHYLFLDGEMKVCEKCLKGPEFNAILNRCNRNNLAMSAISFLEYQFQKTFFPFDEYFDVIIAVSEFCREKHLASRKFSWDVRHLYNFYPDLETTTVEPRKGDYMLFLGRLSKEKGIATLVEAWRRASRSSTLKVAGTGELQGKLVVSPEEKIEFLGYKGGSELRDLIRGASFLIVPSECYENNPLSIVEAYANGKPVIGADIGGIPEIVVNGETGFLFETRNVDDLALKIQEAEAIGLERYETMSRKARRFAEEHFSPSDHYEKLMNIYESAINKSGKKR